MNTLYENIKRLRIEKKMSQDELAKMTGYSSRTSISKIEKGEVDLSQSKIKVFADALGTSPELLLGWDTHSARLFMPSSWSFEIPFISQKLSAGPGKDWISDEDLEIKTINLADDLPRGVDPSTLVCAEVQGDSMEGAHLYSGDVVIFSKGFISGDGIYVLALCGDVLVKRLQYAPWENKVYIISENQKYPTQSVEADNENLVVLGKVLKWFHFEH